MTNLAYSAACERNSEPILAVLSTALADCRRILEIGSGTGQHAVSFARAMPDWTWLPSDRPDALGPSQARVRAEGPPNCEPPVGLDTRARPWSTGPVDAVFSANTLHIMGWPAVEDLFAGLADVLSPGAQLCIYGPFRYAGAYTSASNAAFDQSLRARDPDSGIRDFEAVCELAGLAGLSLVADHTMPANNQLLHWCLRDG